MNVEIKFRGKRLCDGKWIYGDLIHENAGTIVIQTNLNTWGECPDDVDAYGEAFKVITSTVSEYTGIRGKNKREIYENDIVRAWSEGVCIVGVIKRRADGLWVIFPAYQHCRFWHISPNNNGVDDGIEVIGNVYDNPGLLE